jgi:long-chain acyl-CoA synthetase
VQQLLSDALRRAEKVFGDTVAVADGDEHLTYRELGSRCSRLGAGLVGLGVSHGDRVAVLMANGHRYLECYFAIPGTGAVMVPLNNRLAVPEMRYILEDSGTTVLIVDQTYAATGGELAGSVKHVLTAPDEYESLIEESADTRLGEGISEDDLAGLFYTGGTTGAAKGVMLTHRNLVANALHITVALGYASGDVYLHAAPMFHLADGASTYAVTWVGGTHVFVPAFEPKAVMDAISREQVTNALFVPTMLTAILNSPDLGTADFSSLRLVLHGAAPIATELLRTSILAMGCSFAQGYGMTEAAPLLTVLSNEEQLIDDPRLRSAGREIAGVEVAVCREDGSLCAPDEVGEIVARGPNFMRGYWNKPEETAAALRDGWYWSGDLGYRDADGYIFLVDRAKDMIISGGENVYSVEVEDALMSHPAVLEVAVIGVPDEKWGERVHAFVVRKADMSVPAEQLITACRERIAGFKVPRSIDFVDELPRSGAGKILKRELRDRYWARENRGIH